MATPHVAGAVALLLQKKPTLTIAEVTTLLESTTVHPRIESIICTGGGVNITNVSKANISFTNSKYPFMQHYQLMDHSLCSHGQTIPMAGDVSQRRPQLMPQTNATKKIFV